MLHGKVLRPSALNATLTSVEMNGADKLPGVRVVRDGDFVGVTAGNPFAAEQALELLKAQWKAPQQLAEKDLFEYLRKNPDTEARGGFGGRASRDSGSVENAMAAAAKTLSQTYTVAYDALDRHAASFCRETGACLCISHFRGQSTCHGT
jgi:isoquinoline 1-oxidoreductase